MHYLIQIDMTDYDKNLSLCLTLPNGDVLSSSIKLPDSHNGLPEALYHLALAAVEQEKV